MSSLRGKSKVIPSDIPIGSMDVEILFAAPTLPTRDTTTLKTITPSASPPVMQLNAQRGFCCLFQSNQYLTVSSYNLPQSYTKSAIIYLQQTQTVTGNFISSVTSGTSGHFMWLHNNTNMAAGHGSATTAYVSDPTTLPTLTWVHYVVTYDNATTTMKMYRDGTLVSTSTNTALNWPGGGSSGVQLGAYTNTNTLSNVRLDNVRVYNKVLTQADVTSLYTTDSVDTTAYPPADLTANSTALSGQVYGNGTYIASASSSFGQDYPHYGGFNNSTRWWASAGYTYNSGTGAYAGGISTVSSGVTYAGEYLTLQVPASITISAYIMYPTSVANNSAPSTWVLCGSTNNTTWTTLHLQSTAYAWSGQPNYLTYSISGAAAYTYYRFIISANNKNDWAGVDRLVFLD